MKKDLFFTKKPYICSVKIIKRHDDAGLSVGFFCGYNLTKYRTPTDAVAVMPAKVCLMDLDTRIGVFCFMSKSFRK